MAASYEDLIKGMTDYAKSTKLNYSSADAGSSTLFRIGGFVVRVNSLRDGYSSSIRLQAPVMTEDMQFVDVLHAIKWVEYMWEHHRPKKVHHRPKYAELTFAESAFYSVNAAWKVIQADNRTFRAIVHRKGNAIYATAGAHNAAVSIDPSGRIYTRVLGKTEYVSPAPFGTEAITQWFLTLVEDMVRHAPPGNIIQLPRTRAPRIYADPPSVRMTGPPLIKLEVPDVL